jgi:hypothetical protein
MTTHEEMQMLHDTAVMMLPGFEQAQAQMAVCVAAGVFRAVS